MTATTEVILGSTVLELAKGDAITITTDSGATLTGAFVSLTPRGLRMRVGGRYLTRRMSVVTDVELLADELTAS